MSQVVKSEYGREPLEVSDTVPLYSIERRMGSVHVGTPDEEVTRLIERGVQDSQDPRWTREMIDEAIRAALWYRDENFSEYAYVMAGGWG